LVRETIDTYRPQLESNGFRVAAELPDTPVIIRGDRDALSQVLLNLISNAEKYSSEKKEITVQLRSTPHPSLRGATARHASPLLGPLRRRDSAASRGGEGDHNGLIEVNVLDRGMGVPDGAEEKIFEQFYRAHDSLSSGIQGSGLGLTLARQIARAHGGDILYKRRENGGSVFTLRVPGDRSGPMPVCERPSQAQT
jgi:signal transduction histidine kinase